MPGRISILLLATVVMAAARPNILLIVADDMGYSDLGCYGGEIETPVLDELAHRGLRFTNYYVSNMCWPTRASLMTGLYPKTALPIRGAAEGGLHREALTLPEVLRDHGYATYMSGKWHLSNPRQSNGVGAPHRRGFDRFYGTLEGASDYFAPAGLQLNGRAVTEEWKGNPDFYYTDAIVDHALGFVDDHTKSRPDAPFFLYVSFTAAHWPLHARQHDIDRYQGRYSMGWDRLRRDRHERMKEMGVVDPAWKLSSRDANVPAWETVSDARWQERRMEVYAAQVTAMDRNVGRLISWLKSHRLFESTLILFQHDNGACQVEYESDRVGLWTRATTTDGLNIGVRSGNIPGVMPGAQSTFQSYGYGWANASNTPFRLFKQFDHEGGIRSPLILCWPEVMTKELAGALIREVCHVIDVMPTLLDAAGIGDVRQRPVSFEGRSFLPALLRSPFEERPRDPLFWAHNQGRAVRAGEWKLVGRAGAAWELYNLTSDGTETNDVSADYPERVEKLKQLHAAWMERTDLTRRKNG